MRPPRERSDRAADHRAARSPEPLSFPDEATPLYTVGQVAGILGVTAAFLRRLDAERVVSPSRSPGGQRRYSRREIDYIATINVLLREGVTLAGAHRIIGLQLEISELRRQIADHTPG